MVFDLILDVVNGFWQLGDAHAESAITLLPTKVLRIQSKPRSVQSSRWDGANFPPDSRHFVPGYYRAVPPGQKAFAPGAPQVKLTLMGGRRPIFIATLWGHRLATDAVKITANQTAKIFIRFLPVRLIVVTAITTHVRITGVLYKSLAGAPGHGTSSIALRARRVVSMLVRGHL